MPTQEPEHALTAKARATKHIPLPISRKPRKQRRDAGTTRFAERLFVYWYPLAATDEELKLEQQEGDESLGLDQESQEEEHFNQEERSQTSEEERA